MTFRFWYQAITGLITLLLIILFGEKGGVVLAMLIFLPPILKWIGVKKEWDERELQLFYKSNNYTLGSLIVFMVLINILADITVNGHIIGSNWLLLNIAGLVFVQGVAGIITFKMN